MRIDGRALHRYRYEKGLTQTALAATSGVERSAISHMEGGRRPGTPAQIKALAEALEVGIDVLCCDEAVA